MKRADLSWALQAVTPHVGRHAPANVVGLTYRDGYVHVWATDKYTTAIARVPAIHYVDDLLSLSEAVELERFVRPSYRAEDDSSLEYVTKPGEFHVGFDRQVHRDGTTKRDTAVFETVQSDLTLEVLLSNIGQLYAQPESTAGLIYQPGLAAKFAKAARADFERLTIYPRKTSRSGAAVVTVGADFIGAIAGLTESPEPATVASFLSAQERGAA